MDVVSHSMWSYLIWRSWSAPGLAILFGILPDLVSLSPIAAYNAVNRRPLLQEEALPEAITRWKSVTFPIMHSMVVALSACAAVFLTLGPQWWMLAWPLHIFVDVFTHPKRLGTPFLYPFSSYVVDGPFHWSAKGFLALNTGALAVSYGVWVF